jgi:endonuclease/exonuclease/phosphatase family metal-dependent hydrolase
MLATARNRAALVAATAAAALAAVYACAPVTNYLDPSGPHYETNHGQPRDPEPAFRIVTFNVEKGVHVAEAVAALKAHPSLRDADVVLLQEMSAPGVATVAEALRMNSVYFPASRQPHDGADWGNAILSPWPIEDARKILLPHVSWPTGRGRTATVARVKLPGRPVRIYSVHLGSPMGMKEEKRRDQAAVLLADAEKSPEPVVVAGDFNSQGIGVAFLERGYCWPTRHIGPTVMRMTFDHVFAKGGGLCQPAERMQAGVARDVKNASDHRPVWALLGG